MLYLLLVPLLLLSSLLLSLVRNHRRLPRHFHGPFVARITDFWLFKQCITANLHFAQESLLRKSLTTPGAVPHLARIGPNLLVTNDVELLRHMSLPKSRWTRSGWYDGFRMGADTPNVFAERGEERHRALRSKLGNGYSGKGVDSLEPSIDAQTQHFIALLRDQYARPKKVLDLTRVAQFYTLDVLSSIAFGQAFGFMAENRDKWDFVKGNETFVPMVQLITDLAWVRAFFHRGIVQRLFAPKETDEVGMGRVRRFAREAIEKRFEKSSVGERGDMLEAFMERGLSVEECRSESLIQVIAGTDSTSTVLRMTMLYVASNPRVYAKLQEEVEDTVKAGKASTNGIVPDSVTRQLPYLSAVIWEGMRKTPPLFGLKAKKAPAEGETFNGVFFPPGVEVANCLHAVTHRKDIFGEDVDLFRPERWLEGGTDERSKLERTTELVFGTGRFGCLGRSIAWIELGKVIFEAMRHFDWEVVDPLRPIEESRAYGVWIQKGMNMRVRERCHGSDRQ